MRILKKIAVILLVAFLAVPATIVLPKETPTTVEAATPRLNKTKVSLYVGKSKTLKVKKAGKAKVKWKSSNKKVVKVNKKGKITGISEGTAYIYAKVKGRMLCCAVTVKLNVKETKKKTAITIEHTKNGHCSVAIVKNNNSFAISISAKMFFYDKTGKELGTNNDNDYCIGPNQTAILIFYHPIGADYKYTTPSSYKMNYTIKQSYYISYSNKIKTSYEFGTERIIASIRNASGKKLDFTRITCLTYDSEGNLLNVDFTWAPACRAKGAFTSEEFYYPQDSNLDRIIPANVKLYVDYAYQAD